MIYTVNLWRYLQQFIGFLAIFKNFCHSLLQKILYYMQPFHRQIVVFVPFEPKPFQHRQSLTHSSRHKTIFVAGEQWTG